MIVWPPSVSSYATPAALSSSTIAEASVEARLEKSGACVGAVIQRKKKTPPRSSPTSRRPMTTFCPKLIVESVGGARSIVPASADFIETGILMISLNASTALFLIVTTISVASAASELAIM